MRFAALAYHHPRPEHRDELLRGLGECGAALKAQPGLLELAGFDDPVNGRIVAVSIWESAKVSASA